MDKFIMIIAGVTGAACIKLIDGVIQWLLKQREKKIDKIDKQNDDTTDTIEQLKAGMRAIMLDRILYLCKVYTTANEIDFYDKNRLHVMYNTFKTLGGKEDLDTLFTTIDNLKDSTKQI